MLETIALIVGVASSILSSIGYVKGVAKEQKEEISNLFTSIADTLDGAVQQFKNNEVPHGACDALRQYASQLPTILSGTLSDEKVQQYSNDLFQAYNIESLLTAVQNNPNALIDLEKAASSFRVSANVIKLTK